MITATIPTREQAMNDELAQLNEALKASNTSKADFARRCNKSYSWMLTVLCGDYPFYGQRCIPKNIYDVAVRFGLLTA